jgi:hypothetical protein
MALILGDQAAKDPAAAAGPVTGSPFSSQELLQCQEGYILVSRLHHGEYAEEHALEW